MRSPLAPLDLTPFSALTHPVRVRPRLRNWSRTFGCAPEALFAPATAAEAQLVVREARRQSRRVRAVGEHNSPSECWASDDWIISTKHLRGHIIDAEKRIATLGSGLTLGDVHPLLDAHGLALPTSPSILEISIGACFSGSEHGSGAHSEILAAAATHVVLLTSDGNLVTAERDGAHAALFAAAAAGLGLCGIVVEATFACVPAFRLSVRMEKMRLEDTLHDGPGGLLDVARSADMVKLWHFPNAYTHANTIIWRATKTSAPAVPPSRLSRAFGLLQTAATRTLHLLAFLLATHLFPALQPALNTLVFVLRSAGLPKELPATHGWEAQAMDCLYWQLVDEWAVPFAAPGAPAEAKAVTDTAAAPGGALAALRSFLGYLDSPAGRRAGLHAPLELRFGTSDALPLSPLFAPPSSAPATFLWFEPIIYRPLNLPSPARYLAFFRAFEEVCVQYGGRAHSTKAHAPRVRTQEDAARVAERRRVRDAADPDGMWWNAWLERHLGGAGEDTEGAGRERVDDGLEREGVLGKECW